MEDQGKASFLDLILEGLSRIGNARFYIYPFIAIAFSIFVALNTPAPSVKQLSVISSLNPTGDHYEITGRVLQDGDAVDKALIWAIVSYANGQHASPNSAQTDDKGAFSISPIPSTLGAGNRELLQVSIYARKEIPKNGLFKAGSVLRGEDTVRSVGAAAVEPAEVIGLSPWILAPLGVIFLVTAMLPFFGEPTRTKFVWAVVLAFCTTGVMIFYIAFGLKYVTTEGKSKDILQLGFASLYRSTYVKDIQPEWVFSFTAPPRKAAESTVGEIRVKPEPTTSASNAAIPASPTPTPQPNNTTNGQSDTVAIDHGFGAPLWVLLLSVLGAGLVTIGLVIDEITKMGDISNKPQEEQPDEIRRHVQIIVQHQFFVLFAPLSAIFVYQVLIAGSAASSAFTVGLVALGAGPSLSALLTKAGTAATKLFQ